MMNFDQVKIYKNSEDNVFFLNSNPKEIEDILSILEEKKTSLVQVLTIEEEKILMNCYIPFQHKQKFKLYLQRLAKAQVYKNT
jgi:hypothetical protein